MNRIFGRQKVTNDGAIFSLTKKKVAESFAGPLPLPLMKSEGIFMDHVWNNSALTGRILFGEV